MPLFHVLSRIPELKEAPEHYSFLQLHDGGQGTPSRGNSNSESRSRSKSPEQRPHSQADVGTLWFSKLPHAWGAQMLRQLGTPQGHPPPGPGLSHTPSPRSYFSCCGRGRRRHLTDEDPEGRRSQPTCRNADREHLRTGDGDRDDRTESDPRLPLADCLVTAWGGGGGELR